VAGSSACTTRGLAEGPGGWVEEAREECPSEATGAEHLHCFYSTSPRGGGDLETETNDELEPESVMARARSIQAVTSLMAAADMAMWPRLVVRSLSLARMRASTGNAVMDSEKTVKTMSGPRSALHAMAACSASEEPVSSVMGREMPGTAMASAAVRVVKRGQV